MIVGPSPPPPMPVAPNVVSLIRYVKLSSHRSVSCNEENKGVMKSVKIFEEMSAIF